MTAEAVMLLVPAGLAVFAAGVLVGHVATRWGLDRDRERVEVRKDTAVDAAMETALELQRISGEHPEIPAARAFQPGRRSPLRRGGFT